MWPAGGWAKAFQEEGITAWVSWGRKELCPLESPRAGSINRAVRGMRLELHRSQNRPGVAGPTSQVWWRLLEAGFIFHTSALSK